MLVLMFLPSRVVSLTQFSGHVLYTQSLVCEQDYEVVQHVRPFVHQTLVGAVGGFYDQFERLFSHLLCHAVQSVTEEACGVTAFRHFLMTLFDEVAQFAEKE